MNCKNYGYTDTDIQHTQLHEYDGQLCWLHSWKAMEVTIRTPAASVFGSPKLGRTLWQISWQKIMFRVWRCLEILGDIWDTYFPNWAMSCESCLWAIQCQWQATPDSWSWLGERSGRLNFAKLLVSRNARFAGNDWLYYQGAQPHVSDFWVLFKVQFWGKDLGARQHDIRPGEPLLSVLYK